MNAGAYRGGPASDLGVLLSKQLQSMAVEQVCQCDKGLSCPRSVQDSHLERTFSYG